MRGPSNSPILTVLTVDFVCGLGHSNLKFPVPVSSANSPSLTDSNICLTQLPFRCTLGLPGHGPSKPPRFFGLSHKGTTHEALCVAVCVHDHCCCHCFWAGKRRAGAPDRAGGRSVRTHAPLVCVCPGR